ncbi:hypothetical protein LCGC14_3076180 [marine sediment metagenome]|uniref:Uncharacterized protein n=1 Tax=marine sediment metagenome TaxID=412755 RepID=A0A0F8Z5B5_9ZZZZ
MDEDIRTPIAKEIDRLRKAPSKAEYTSEQLDILFKALIGLNSIQDKIINPEVV